MTRVDTALRVLCSALRTDVRRDNDPVARLDNGAWLDVLVLANAHRLGPALRESLARTNRLGLIPDDVRAYLDLLYRGNRDRNAVVRQQAIELVAALNSAGVRPLLLKGVLALVADDRRDPAARIMADIDIAVPSEARCSAERVVTGLGYRVGARYPEGHHAVAEFRRRGDPAAVDLHVELIDQRYVLPVAAVFARARLAGTDTVPFFVPAATDGLLHTLLHAQLHHLGQYYFGRIALDQLYDFCLLAGGAGGTPIGWCDIAGRLRDHGLTDMLDSYLIAANRLFGLPWPLDRPPVPGADRQVRRWRMHLHAPALMALGVPTANLSAAFALHRMSALYGDRGGPISWRLRHAQQYLQRHNPREIALRIFRGIRMSG